MDNQPKKNTEDEQLGDAYGVDNGTSGKMPSHTNDYTGSDNLNDDRPASGDDEAPEGDNEDTDKYLAMEQPGVQYTEETEYTTNSDNLDYGDTNSQNMWTEEGNNSKNSDAFNQDDYLLEDNVDLDEDQAQSISSDDEDFEETNERYTN
jgi:hypothetical protein